MNAGMYGMADGRGMAARKLLSQVQSPTVDQSFYVVGAMAATQSRSADSPTISAGVRTRLVAVSGKGAARMAAFGTSGAVSTVTYELFIDGVKVKSFDSISMSSGSSLVLVGSGGGNNTYPAPSPDFITFDASCEIWVTSSAPLNGGSARHFYWIDLHQ